MTARSFCLLTPEGKGILADLDKQGVVTFAIEAGSGSSIRGSELFNRMMQFFGADVRAIHGVWCKGPLGRPSAKIDRMNELTAAGVSLVEALHHAWTVTRAKKLGFQKVRLLERPEGQPGAYTRIDVWLEK